MGQTARMLCLGLATASPTALAWAQEPPPTTPTTTVDGPVARGQIEEIVITAERQAANLQDVPISVTALTADAIEAQGITNINELAANVPNLTSTTGPQGSADANFFVRGVGQFDFIATNDPGVGVYVDGVYLGRTVGALLDAGDIGRVEVLRGPQGTLFGRNTLGGAVSITSVAPDPGEFAFRGRVTTGSRDRFDADVAVNAPLGEDAALRVYALTRSQDGFAQNPITGTRFGAIERRGFKTQFLVEPDERLTIAVSADYTEDRSNPAPSVLLAVAPLPFFPADIATQVQDRDDFYRVFGSNAPKSDNEVWGISANVAYDFGGVTLRSISAYRELNAFSTSDPDGTTYRLYDQSTPTDQHQFSQEFQLTGDLMEDRLNFLIGGYYFNERVDQTLFLCFAPITPTPTQFLNPCNTWNQGNDQRTNSYAVFGQARYNFTPALSLTLGGRYTWEDKEIVSNQAFDFRPAGFSPAPGVVVPGFLAPIVTDLRDEVDFQKFTPKVGVEWEPDPDILLFASWARGFRSGGFNGRLIVPQIEVPTYEPDETDAFEVGVKSDLFNRSLRLNLTGYYTKYRDIQQTISDPEVQFRVANAGDARIFGFEAEATAVPIDNLRLTAGVGYANSEFEDVPITVGDINGNRLPFSPEWTVSAAAEYALELGPVRAVPRVDYRFTDRQYFTPFNNEFPGLPDDGFQEQQGPLGLWSARLTLTDPEERYSLAVFGENLTDEEYYTFGQNALFAQGVSYNYLGRPREWGVTLGVRF